MALKVTLATKKRALELGATYIEQELALMRDLMSKREDAARSGSALPIEPLTTSHEADIMKVAEWASAAATLRAMAADA